MTLESWIGVGLVIGQGLQALYTRVVQLSIAKAKAEADAKAERELAAHKLHVAENYVPYERFDRTADKIFEKLDQLAARLPHE